MNELYECKTLAGVQCNLFFIFIPISKVFTRDVVTYKNVEELIRELDTLNKTEATKKLTKFYVNARFRELAEDDFRHQYTDGRNDGGIDFYQIEDGKFYIIQSKFSANAQRVDEGSILEEIRKIKNTLTSENPNKKAENFVNSLKRKLGDPNALLEVIWLTTNIVKQSTREHIQDKLNELRINNNWGLTLDFVAIDKYALDGVIYDVKHGYIPSTGKRILRIENGQYIETTTETTGVYSVLCSVNINEILNWFKDSREIESFLQKNVRGYLGDDKINKKIKNSYSQLPNWFWYKHNGIIIFADSVSIDKTNSQLILRNPQVVNGGQTLTTLFSTYDKNGRRDNNATVLIRVYRLGYEDAETYKNTIEIIAALNTQNKVRSSDLHSTDPRQVRLEQLMKRLGYTYYRKRAKEHKSSRSSMTMRNLAMVYYICKKQAPHEGVLRHIEELFDENAKYEYVFPEPDINAELRSSHVVLRYITAWNIYNIVKRAGTELPKRYRELSYEIQNFVITDVYNKLLDWKKTCFDFREWMWWKKFVESYELEDGLWDYCQKGFRIGHKIIPRLEDHVKFLKTKEATEKFDSAIDGKRTFESAANRALRNFKEEEDI